MAYWWPDKMVNSMDFKKHLPTWLLLGFLALTVAFCSFSFFLTLITGAFQDSILSLDSLLRKFQSVCEFKYLYANHTQVYIYAVLMYDDST
jgi:hypothetical protein